MYGNETQQDTPTTLILEKRGKHKLESDGKFRLAVKIYPATKAKVIASALEQTLKVVRDQEKKEPNKQYTFSLEVEET
jgi:hypothetical protein